MAKRLEITVSDETWDRLNDARGHEPRASFVKRALEAALDGQALKGAPGEVSPGRLKSDCSIPASPRAPKARSIYVPGVGSVPDDEGGRRVAAQVEAARNDPVLERQFFAGLPESQQPAVGRLPAEEAKRSAPRLAVRQGKGVFTPRPKGKS